jgi:hypothetical protein
MYKFPTLLLYYSVCGCVCQLMEAGGGGLLGEGVLYSNMVKKVSSFLSLLCLQEHKLF